jgi:hypothetical protein
MKGKAVCATCCQHKDILLLKMTACKSIHAHETDVVVVVVVVVEKKGV